MRYVTQLSRKEIQLIMFDETNAQFLRSGGLWGLATQRFRPSFYLPFKKDLKIRKR